MNLSALRHKNFRLLFLGQAISQIGDSFYYLVFLFMVKKVTGRSDMVGYVGALETIPFLLFGPYAGVIADRIDRRKIMLWSDIACGLLLLAFAAMNLALGRPPIWSLLAIPFVLSSIRVFFMPAKTASIPRLVPESLLTEANSLSWGTQTLVGMLGLSISAGVLGMLYVISPKYFYVSSIGINAVSFAISAAFLVRLPSIVPQREHHEVPHPWQDFKDGLRFVNRFHELKVIIALLSVFRLMIAPFFVFYLAMNDKWFGGKPQTIVWLEIFFSGGMLAATLAIGRWKIKRPLLWFANGLAAVGVTVLVMAWCRSVWPFAVLQVIAGLGVPPSEIPVTTYLQRSVQDSYRGRVNSVRETVSVGIMPLGMVLGGVLIDRIGIQGGFILMGAGTLAACLFGLLDPRFRSAQMPPLKDAPSVGSPDLGVPSHA